MDALKQEQGRGDRKREGFAGLSGKCQSISRRIETAGHKSSQPHVRHMKKVKPGRTSWGSESPVGTGQSYIREEMGVWWRPGSPRPRVRSQTTGRPARDVSPTARGPGFQGGAHLCRLAAVGVACMLVERGRQSAGQQSNHGPRRAASGCVNEGMRPPGGSEGPPCHVTR